MLEAALGLALLAAPSSSSQPTPYWVVSNRASPPNSGVVVRGYLENGSLSAPARQVATLASGYVHYTPYETYIVADGRVVILKAGARVARDKLGRTIYLPLRTRIENKTLYVPLRAVLEYFGARVSLLAAKSTPIVDVIFLPSVTVAGTTVNLPTITAPPLTPPPLTPPPYTAPPVTTPPTLTTGTAPPLPIQFHTFNASRMPNDTNHLECSPGLWWSPKQCKNEATAAMIDLIIFTLLLAPIFFLVRLRISWLDKMSSWEKSAFAPEYRKVLQLAKAIRVTQWILGVVAVILIAEGVFGFINNVTFTSLVYIAPFFLNTMYSFFVLLIVLSVVALGIRQSFLQFEHWMEEKRRLQSQPPPPDTQIQLSITKGITITTPMIGLATLALSIALLYVFLVYGRAVSPP